MTSLMLYLIGCNVLDIVTGFLKAYDQKIISSRKMRHGALCKLSIWCVIVVSMIVSDYLKTDLTTYVTGYYLIMEVVSIFENVSVFVPVPEKLKNMLDTHTTQKEPKETEKTDKTVQMIDSRIFDEINKKGDNHE